MITARRLRTVPVEAIIWIGALIALAFYHPVPGTHFTLCPLANIGFRYCPGCGLGRSISYILHGDFQLSWKTHPLGVFAVVILGNRIVSLFRTYLSDYGQSD